MTQKVIILASASPRRQELLRLITDEFAVMPTNVDETLPDNTGPEEAVRTLALRKARAAVGGTKSGDIVVGSDTIVVAPNGHILGKPCDRQEAADMLRTLSGSVHRVVTGAAVLCGGKETVFTSDASVTFCEMTDDEIDAYLDTGEPFDKAGAYGIQGRGARYITGISGDYYAVVGLPVQKLYKVLCTLQ